MISNSDFTFQWTEVFNPSTHGSTYGTPILDGNTLKFGENSQVPNAVPMNFASLSFGSVVNSDGVDGKLILTITATGDNFLNNNLILYEQGGWFFGPNGTSFTSSSVSLAGASISVDGGSPMPLSMTFYDPAPDTTGNKIFRKTIDSDAGTWQGCFIADLKDFPQAQRVDLIFDNVLFTASEPGTSAFIDKKRLWIGVNDSFDPPPRVPEPASLWMLGIAAALGFGWRRWKR